MFTKAVATIAALVISVCASTSWAKLSEQEMAAYFQTGVGYLQAGRPNEAARYFAEILAEDPSLVRVRLELAFAYYQAGLWQRARREFMTALSADLPEPVRQRVLQFVRAIDARRGFEWDLQIGIIALGDGRNYDSDLIELDFGGGPIDATMNRDNSNDYGVRFNGVATWRHTFLEPNENRPAGVGFLSFSVIGEEGPKRQYDDYSLTGRAGARFAWPTTTMSVAPFMTRRFLAGDVYEDAAGIEVIVEKRAARGQSFSAVMSWREIDNVSNDLLDGDQINARLQYVKSLSGKAQIGASLSYEDTDVEFLTENDQITRFTVFGRVDVAGGFTLRPRLYAEKRHYETPSPVFTANPDQTTFGGGLRVESSTILFADGFSPYIDVSLSRTKSDIPAFSYREGEVSVGVERRF